MTYVRPISPFSSALVTDTCTKPIVTYNELEVEFRPEDGAFWCYLAPQSRPCFTPELLAELHRVQAEIAQLATTSTSADRQVAVRWVVLASRTPGFFSLGGDLTAFSRLIHAGNRESLRRYAHSCVEIGHLNSTGYGGDAVTIGLAQGDALGGGFESLLSCDLIVAEKRARFGLPEVIFGLFPGMGAHAFLGRRVSPAAAQRMILSGEMHSAEEMYALGVVDLLVEDGTGEAAVRDYIVKNGPRHNAHAAAHKARRRLFAATLSDLQDVADIWVDAAMRLSDQELRRMAMLIAAQDRTRARMALMT